MKEFGVSKFKDLKVSGDLTVSGNTTTSTNTTVTDKLIELANGTTGTPSADSGIIIERGDSANAAFVYDESAGAWVAATTSATGASSGALSLTPTDLNISDLQFTPDGITTSHITTTGSLDIRATANIKIGTDGADSVRIGRTNTTAAKIHVRSGADSDLVVHNSMVGIGTETPDHTLSVAGDIDLTGGLSFDGGTAVTSIDTDLSSVSGSDDTLASAKAVKAYVDSVATAADLDFTTDTAGTSSVDLDAETLTFAGSNGASVTHSGQTITVAGTDATTSAKGVASFSSDNFDVSSGAVTIKAGGVDLAAEVTGTLPVGNGGTGATTLTDGGILLGSGTGAITASAVLGNGELLIGDNSGDPTVATLSAGEGIDITNGAGSITIAAEESSASNLGAVIVAGGTDVTVSYSSGTATVAVDDLSTSKITSGTFADARIAASNVTQHQGSITGSGALNSGSITSGFGNIDVGSSTIDTTGAVSTGDLTVAGGDVSLGDASNADNVSVKAVNESGTNTAGKNLTVGGGLGTGTGVPGSVEITSGIPTSSGTGSHTSTPVAIFDSFGVTSNFGGIANLANDTGIGEIVYFGTEHGSETLAAGRLVYLASDGNWRYADADAEVSTASLIGIALGDSVNAGILLKGFFKVNTYVEGSFAAGAACYVSEAASEIDFTAPSAAGDHLRIVGYGTATTGVIYFNPSSTTITL